MNSKDFDDLVENRLEMIKVILISKGADYQRGEDRLSNFKRAASMLGTTPEKALLGMLAKHIVSVMDYTDDTAKGATILNSVWNEKLGDCINYFILLEGLVKERNVKEEGEPCQDLT